MPRHGILDIEERTDGPADLFAVVQPDSFGPIDEHPDDAALATHPDLEIRQFVAELHNGWLK